MILKDGERLPLEWDAFPRIDHLVDVKAVKHPERLLRGRLTLEDLLSSFGAPSDIWPPETVDQFRDMGLILDVGCGINGGNTEPGVSTPVGVIPNAYGIDPVLEFLPAYAVEGRTLPAYAEDMPFEDGAFDYSFSSRGLGWYAETFYNSYWVLKEMIRVSKKRVMVMIGSGSGLSPALNYQRTMDAISRIQREALGERIETVRDFSNYPSPQITLGLK